MADPAAIRFNNPGAMWPGASARLFGATSYTTLNDGQNNRIAQFPDAESGAAAQFDLLKRGYAGLTLSDALKKWSGGNHAGAYLAHVSKTTGLAPGTVLTPEFLSDPTKAIPFAKAMAQWEAGRPYPMTDDQWNSAHRRYLGGPQTASNAAPQNYDMYGETVKPSSAPITTGSIQGRSMPQDPVTGAWTPEEVIKSRFGLAQQFRNTPDASTPLGALAKGLGGLFGGVYQGDAENTVRANQAIQQDALRRAAQSGSTDAIARTMISSGIPQLAEQGVGILSKNLSADEARNTPLAQAQLKEAQIRARAAEENARHSAEMHPAQLDLTRAQAEQARRKDAMQRFKESILLGDEPQAPQPGFKPMSDEAPMPSVPGVTLVNDKPQQSGPAVDESKLSPRDWLRLQAKKDPLWVMNFMAQMDKDPSKAQEMLDQRRGKLTTGTKTKLEETLSGLVNMRGNLSQVAGQFKPEYLQVSNQAQQWWNAVRDKTGIEKLKLDPQEQAKLAEFAKFRSSSIGVLNARLKELSGAAVTESEYRRIAAELPNPGTGIADGDSPTQFKAKMDSVLRMANLGIARTHYLIRNGFAGSVEEAEKQMPLDAVPQKMNEVGNQILQELKIKNPGVAEDKLIPQARQEVAKQFGISI